MVETNTNMKPAIKMELASMNDLVRMAFFSAARNNGLNFLAFTKKKDKKWYIGFLTGVAGYFELRGVPMFFYVKLDTKPEKSNFIQYAAKEKEKWSYVESTAEPAKWNYLPIIELANEPTFL